MTMIGNKRDIDEVESVEIFSLQLSSYTDIIWELVASFSAPPDSYNFALTSKHFHVTNDVDDDGIISSGNEKLLATRMLRKSLLSSLGQVLKGCNSNIDLDAVLALGTKLDDNNNNEFPEKSVIIAGSTIVQTCLGEIWKHSDVDIYCLSEYALQVRSWLVEEAKCMFVGFKDDYISLTDDRLLFTVGTHIHHVEKYGSLKSNVNDAEEYKTACEQGEDWYTQYYVQQNWNNTIRKLGRNTCDSEYTIGPKEGGKFPFDFDGDGEIDLCVGLKVPPHLRGYVTALDLLDSFDLNICKASFDGTTFRIPEPHLMFNRKTSMEPHRRAILGSYIKHYGTMIKSGEYDLNDPYSIDQSVLASRLIENVRHDLGSHTDFQDLFFNVDLGKQLPDKYDSKADLMEQGHIYDEMVQWKYGMSVQFHNWVCKLYCRLKKYQGRNIEVLGSLIAANDSIDIKRFNISSS